MKRKVDLDGKTWMKYSISIWSDIKKSLYERTLKHPAMFPIELASRLIQIFSSEGDLILDPFAGSGSTLIAAKRLKRYSIGIELSKDFVELYYSREDRNQLTDDISFEPTMYNDNALNLRKIIEDESVQLTVTSPPYWNILNRKRTADYKETVNYSDEQEDLGNIESYDEFIQRLKNIFQQVFLVTKKGGFCCINLMDIRKKDKLYTFHIDAISFMKDIGFELDDIIIWDRRHEYNNFRPLGYPYVFRINRAHEYILIFKK
ncbi:DNA methyltransferase [Caloranaerobacter sp. DY30410]|uniref:DNA methyltransferase n=1 Tax=Caloranaerobacter sp. DY30410 TaxID=3238305 RepID=UPI003CFC9B12